MSGNLLKACDMPKPAKGLYAPLLVDITFAVLGIGSAALLGLGSQKGIAIPEQQVPASAGPFLLAIVVACGVAACLYHRIDRQGWDDYMAQVVSQSALIGMVTLLMAAAIGELAAVQILGSPLQLPLMMGALPMAALAWAIGYFFLRWRGTGE